MKNIGIKEIATIVGVDARSVRRWATRPEWPAPSVKAKPMVGGEARWSVPDLPHSLSIKGKIILVRDPVKEVFVQRLLNEGKQNHEKTIVEKPKFKADRPLVKNRLVGQNLGGNSANAEGRAVGANEQQEGFRAVTLLPGSAKPAQPHRQDAPVSSDRLVRSAGNGLAETRQVAALKGWQKSVAEARAALLGEVDRIAAIVGREKAIAKVTIMAADGTLPEHLAQLVPVANARSGKAGKRTISRRTIYRWIEEFNGKAGQGGSSNQAVNALAPKDSHAVLKIPAWAPVMLGLYQQPQGVSLAWVCREMEPLLRQQDIKIPSYDAVRRFLGKMGAIERQIGRMGSRQIKNIKPFVRRDSSMLWPGEVYTADGHRFDAEVAHPAHGRPFRPEITAVLDVNTRRCVGWSIDLAESGLAVLDALRNACEAAGICALFYVDNGSGYHNAVISAPGTGLVQRLGITMTHSWAYNSQARGIIERSHQSIWIAAAKELPTYIGATMDSQAKQKVHKLTRKDVKSAGKSKFLMSFQEFVKFCEIKVAAYNARPHSSLPKIWDEALGKKRRMSPNDAWAAGVAEGAALDLVLADEAQDLFHPQKEVALRRGELRLFGTWYFNDALKEHHGETVRVGYDVRNAQHVWVYDQEGRFLCTAGLQANLQPYFQPTVVEKAVINRAKGRLRRIENKRGEVLAELAGSVPKDITTPVLENDNSPVLSSALKFTGLELVEADFSRGEVEATAVESVESAAPVSAKRPMFYVESERYEWLMQNQGEWMLNDAQFLQRYLSEEDGYALLTERFELLGMGWSEENQRALNAFVITADQDVRSA